MELNVFKLRDRYDFIVENYLINGELETDYQVIFKAGQMHLSDDDFTDKEIYVERSSFYMKSNKNPNSKITWSEFVSKSLSETSTDIKYYNEFQKTKFTETPFGILLFEMSDTSVYAICFGYSSLFLSQYADSDFGLDFAERVLIDQTIDVESKQHVNANKKKSLTVFSLDALSSVEYGSADDFIKGRILTNYAMGIEKRQSFSKILKYINPEVSFGVSVKFKVKKHKRSNVIKNYEQISELLLYIHYFMKLFRDKKYITVRIPRLTYISTKTALYDRLNQSLVEAINKDDISIGIDFYSVIGSDIKINDEIIVRINKSGMSGADYENLSIEHVKAYISGNANYSPIEILKDGKVKFEDGSRRQLISLISADVYDDITDKEYILVNGKWASYNQTFYDYIESEINDIHSKNIISILDEPYSCHINELVDYLEKNDSKLKKKYREYVYNERLAELKGFICLDTRNHILNKYPNVEIADIYDDQELIHVKIGGLGKFIENIEQSTLAATVMVEKESKLDFNALDDINKPLKDSFTSSLLLVFENRNIDNLDIRTLKSMKFKSYLIEWYKTIERHNLSGRIYIACITKDNESFTDIAKRRGLIQ